MTVEDAEGKRGYAVKLTEAARSSPRSAAPFSRRPPTTFSPPFPMRRVAQPNALTEKIILSCKENGAHGSRKHGKKRHHGRKHCRR